MSTTTPILTVKDSTTFTLNEADLTGKEFGDSILTPKRDVPYFDGLQWWIDYKPAGYNEANKGHVGMYLCINKSVTAKFTFAVNGSSIGWTYTCNFPDSSIGYGRHRYASHEELRPLFHDGKLTITCRIEFDILKPNFPIPRNFQLFEHVGTDVEFVVGTERVPAHKSFLALVSPVFQAMFAHKTTESKSGKIVITEFDVDTVKAAIDICYGRESEVLSVEVTVNILRFCDKYFITAVINELEKLPLLTPTVETFCTVIQYAYDCNKNSLLTTCYNFFMEHQDEIKATQKFAELPPALAVDVVKSAFELKTDFDVLRHAHKNGIQCVVDHLERPLIDSMTLDTFCPAVNFAWECSRDELKKVCASFLNDRYCEVIMLESFFELPSESVRGVLKLGYDLKCDAE